MSNSGDSDADLPDVILKELAKIGYSEDEIINALGTAVKTVYPFGIPKLNENPSGKLFVPSAPMMEEGDDGQDNEMTNKELSNNEVSPEELPQERPDVDALTEYFIEMEKKHNSLGEFIDSFERNLTGPYPPLVFGAGYKAGRYGDTGHKKGFLKDKIGGIIDLVEYPDGQYVECQICRKSEKPWKYFQPSDKQMNPDHIYQKAKEHLAMHTKDRGI